MDWNLNKLRQIFQVLMLCLQKSPKNIYYPRYVVPYEIVWYILYTCHGSIVQGPPRVKNFKGKALGMRLKYNNFRKELT